MAKDELYEGREQTAVKHRVLEDYLLPFALILGTYRNITYVDCFSGPWRSASDDLSDTSFSIAVMQLRKARELLRARGKEPRIRCLFLEKNAAAYAHLKEFSDRTSDIEIRTLNARFEVSIPEILKYADEGGHRDFPFFFIDPTGWSGIRIRTISPILKHQPGEVLINFMTSHIRRWLGTEHHSYEDLFGSDRYDANLEEASGEALDDELLFSYCDAIRREGKYYVSSAVVLHPQQQRAHFHLVYATRDIKGLHKFKEAEAHALTFMNEVRATAQQRTRVARTGPELFSADVFYDCGYVEHLKARYQERARRRISGALTRLTKMSYDDLVALWWRYPLTTEGELKEWIRSSRYRVIGLGQNERGPKIGKNHIVTVA